MPREDEVREAIDKVTRHHVEWQRQNGGNPNPEDIRNRVAAAVKRGDLKRQE